MGKLVEVMTPLHKSTKRKYLERMMDDKVNCMLKAKEYEFDYWDGDRRFGYGGYKYDGRWKPIAEKLIEMYNLKKGDWVLDVGCGKGYLLYELRLLGMNVVGFDISMHAITNALIPITYQKAQLPYPFRDKSFDLVISLMTLHNLKLPELEVAIKEIQRVGKHKYIYHEAYRNEQEQFNLECWALTAETILDDQSWIWLYNHFGYTGNYEFAYFE